MITWWMYMTVITGFKGFNFTTKDDGSQVIYCRNLQYPIGVKQIYSGRLELCESGLHFCKELSYVFSYYPPGKYSVYGKVKADGQTIGDVHKTCSTDLTLVELLNGTYTSLGNTFSFKDGRLHSDDGPAVLYANGTAEWWRDGKRHREDGPARIAKEHSYF